MKLGLKVGPIKWEQVLSKVTPECAEVWFKLDMDYNFQTIYEALYSKQIPFGLHFWAATKEGYEPNLAYRDKGVADQSEELVQQTIDIAADNGASYVNVHPGSLTLKKIDFGNKTMRAVEGSDISYEEGYETLKSKILALQKYAESKNILFLVETLPSNELEHFRDETGRAQVVPSGNIGVDMLEKLAHDGTWITNDYGHTLANWVSEDREDLWSKLFKASKVLAPRTRLVHINTVRPPFNGTDSHDGIQESDFKRNVLPTRDQLKQLISLYKGREDVWLIPEPQPGTAVDNYKALTHLISEI